jgi:predicted P-loop ATPase
MSDPATTPQWRDVNGKGKPISSLSNVRNALCAMQVYCQYDRFRQIIVLQADNDAISGELDDPKELMLRTLIMKRFGFEPNKNHSFDAIMSLAYENGYDPILDQLKLAQSKWDGKKRLDTWVIKYLGVPDTPLNRVIGRLILVAAARRARQPGCKWDIIIVLEGPEGTNKSSAIRILAGDAFFSDQHILGKDDKTVQEQLCGIWMHECADLTGLRKAETEHVKAFASRQVDRARPAYGRVLTKQPRRCIEWATTNDDTYLQSQTGNRRFWPMVCGVIDLNALLRDRQQLLGEAAHYEAEGESIVLDQKLWSTMRVEQEQRRVKDAWEYLLRDIGSVKVERRNPLTGQWEGCIVDIINVSAGREQVFAKDLLNDVLNVPKVQQDTRTSMRLAATMKTLGWQRNVSGMITIDGERGYGYFRDIAGVRRPEAAKLALRTTPPIVEIRPVAGVGKDSGT